MDDGRKMAWKHIESTAAVVISKRVRGMQLSLISHLIRGPVYTERLSRKGNPPIPRTLSIMSEFEVWSRALKQVLPEAEKRMDIRPIITKLDSNNLLNYYEYAEVEGLRNRIEQTRKVFQCIGNKDTLYIHKFVYILETSDGFEHWARTIKEYAGVPVTEVVGKFVGGVGQFTGLYSEVAALEVVHNG